jgi:tyrosinase
MVVIRRDAHRLAEWDDIILWYSRAVGELQSRPITDPTGWRFMAAVHAYWRGLDPFALEGEAMPSASIQRRYWDRCQHSSWYFLPWHRAYLTYFERTIRKTIRDLGGPEDWALPYWNYSDLSNPSARFLPPAFTRPNRPDGTSNPLFVQRQIDGPGGARRLDPREIDLSCLKLPNYIGVSSGGSAGFGGPRTAFNHGGGANGALEVVPHGVVHVAVGNWMGAFETAGLDPIFWLHHCNIDRLWEVWLARRGSHSNPIDADWLDAVGAVFEFHDENAQVVTALPRNFVDPSLAPMEYNYEDIGDPFTLAVAATGTGPTMAPSGPAKLLASSQTNLELAPDGLSAMVPSVMGAAASIQNTDHSNKHIYLNVENVTAEHDGGSYEILLGPVGESESDFRKIGLIAIFGAQTRPSADGTSRSGITQVIDATPESGIDGLLLALREDRIEVRFRPLRPPHDDAQIKVGRISFYVE